MCVHHHVSLPPSQYWQAVELRLRTAYQNDHGTAARIPYANDETDRVAKYLTTYNDFHNGASWQAGRMSRGLGPRT